MGSARLASIHELYLSDAPQIESAWRQWSDDDLKDLVPPGRSLSHVKQQLENGDALLLSDSPKLPLFTKQQNDFSLPVSGGDIPATAVKHIQQRFATAGSSAHFQKPNGSLHPAIEPNYTPDTRVTQIAPDKPLPMLISPKFGQARRELLLGLTYDDAECTPAIQVPYRVEFEDGTIIEGNLDKQGKTRLDNCPKGHAWVVFGSEADQAQAEQALPALYEQLDSALDSMAAELATQSEQALAQAKAEGKLPEMKASLRDAIDAHLAELRQQQQAFESLPGLTQYWCVYQSAKTGTARGVVEYVPDLGEFGELMDAAGITLSALVEAIATGDIDELEQKLQQWQQRGEAGLELASEAMEMLILLLSDAETRSLLASLPERYLLALPQDKSTEIVFYSGTQWVADYGIVSAGTFVGSLFAGVGGPAAGAVLLGATTTRKGGKLVEETSNLLMDIAKANKQRRNHHKEQSYVQDNLTPLDEGTTPNYGLRIKNKDKNKVKEEQHQEDDGVHPSLVRMRPPVAVPCFRPSDNMINKFPGSREDLERHYANQLKHQEAGLNDLTLAEYIENRQRYRDMQRGDAHLSQKEFRDKFKDKTTGSLLESYQKKLTERELEDDEFLESLERRAEKRATEIMQDLAALHDPDMVAAGYGDNISRMGNSRVNSSIGSQWAQRPKGQTGAKSRVAQLDEAMEKALQRYGPEAAKKIKLQVQLKRCPVN